MSPDRPRDPIAVRLRELDPAVTPRDAAPPAFLVALGERLTNAQAAEDRRRARQRRRRTGWAVSLASVVAVAAVAVSLTLTSPRAEAATPAPLTFSAPAPEQQVVDDAIARLSQGGGVDAPERSVRMVSWGITVEDGVIDEGPVVPQLVSLDWKADLSGRSVIREGRTEPASGGQVGRVVATGTVLDEQTFAAGEFGVPSADAPAQSEAGVRALLTSVGMPADPTPDEVMQSVATAMELWTLSDKQHAELLRVIAMSGKVESLGRAVDRLGRDVLGLQVTTASGGTTETVLISADTGRIVGEERQFTTAADGIPAGTVVAYRLWDAEERTSR